LLSVLIRDFINDRVQLIYVDVMLTAVSRSKSH
jgi:hypothetical protein